MRTEVGTVGTVVRSFILVVTGGAGWLGGMAGRSLSWQLRYSIVCS